MSRPVVAFDTETAWITDFDKAPLLTCVSWAERSPDAFGPTSDLFKWDHPIARTIIATWLASYVCVGANIGYDMAVLMRQWPELTPLIFEAYEQGRVCDVQVSAKLVDNAEGIMHRHPVYVLGQTGKPTNYSLAALAKRFMGKDLDKTTWRMGYGELRDVPLDQWEPGARQYAIDDAVSTLEVYEALQLGYPELLEDQFRQARHAFWLHLVGVHGVCTDPVRVATLEKRLRTDHEERVKRLLTVGLIHPKKKKDPKTGEYKWSKNTKAAKARMIKVKGGFDNCKKTDGGKKGIPDVCLDAEVCEESGDEMLEAYAEVTSITKRLGTEIKALNLGQLHVRYDSYKVNGRSGCSEPANLQNLPREGGERECYVPRPGYVFVDADYDMLELRTWAQVCLETVGVSTLADELNNGIDVHLSMAGEIYEGGGHSYEYMKAHKKEQKVKEARQTAKPVNFMLPGGGGAERLVAAAKKDYGLVLPSNPEGDMCSKENEQGERYSYVVPGVDFARKLIAAWERKRSEAKPYLRMISAMVKGAGGKAVLKALFVNRYHGGLGYCDLANFHFSCLANDIAKDAGWRVTRACWDWTRGDVLYGSRIVLFPHDQLIVESPIAIGHECAMSVQRHMVEAAKPWLPDVPATTTPCLATCFSKMAEPYYDESGRLIPWSLEGQCAKDIVEFLNRACALWAREQTKEAA